MSCKQLRGDVNYAWPTAEIAVMGAEGAVGVLYAKEAKNQADPAAYLKEKEDEYTALFANPYNAAKYGYIDDVIMQWCQPCRWPQRGKDLLKTALSERKI